MKPTKVQEFWTGPKTAQVLGMPPCGYKPDSLMYAPSGCTREAGHEGEHRMPNRDGRLSVRNDSFAPEVRIYHSHGPASLRVHNRDEADALLAFLAARFNEIWPMRPEQKP